MKQHRRVCATINLDAVAENFVQMKNNLKSGTRIIAVVKADGYGLGAIPIAQMVEPYDYIWGFGVATVEEAIILRDNGITKPILLLSFTFPEDYDDIVRYDLQPTVFKLSMAKELSRAAVGQKKEVFVHIAVDTGMSRIGFADEQDSISVIADIKKLPNVKMEGIFTHFARADEKDKGPALAQMNRFEVFLRQLECAGIHIPLRHCSNSAGIMQISEANMDLVRAGISIYGMYPSDDVARTPVSLTPVMELKSHITYIKTVKKGTQIGYGGTYTAPAQMRIATIPVGYADGYARSLSNKGYVLVRGQRAPIVGRICMDQFMVDVSQIPEAAEFDEVTLLGRDGNEIITMEYLGDISGRFNYEFACNISKRVPRVYLRTKNS